MLLARLFERIITTGRLRLVDAVGKIHEFAGTPGPNAAIRLHDTALHRKLVTRPRLYLPEAFVDGTLTLEEGSLYDLIDLLQLEYRGDARRGVVAMAERILSAAAPPTSVQSVPPSAPQRRASL